MKIVLNEIVPAIQKVTLNCIYHGFAGIAVGTGFILHGIFTGFLLIPKKAPIRTKGVEQNSHNTANVTISKNFAAADDFSIAKIIFRMLLLKIIYHQ